MRRKATRRELVRGGIGLATAASLAARAAPAAAAAPTGSEAQALSHALQLERLAVIAYDQVLASNALSPDVSALLRMLGAQEQQHVAKLEQLLRQLGATVPQGPASVPAAQALLTQRHVHRGLTDLPTQYDCLRLLIDVESLTEGAYFDAIPQLQDPRLVTIALEIMGTEAAQSSVISTIQHNGNVGLSVPYPFVQGTP